MTSAHKLDPPQFESAQELLIRLARVEQELETVYAALYDMVHDVDHATSFAARKTVAAFGHQWANVPDGRFMLSDRKFKEEVDEIIVHEELLIDRVWFGGKRVLDAGCGGGRWSYGLAKLGAHVTAVDTNPSAIEATRSALLELGAPADFLQCSLEELGTKLPAESFDLVWSWGVLHHCASFMASIRSVSRLLRPGGLLHLYLYGRAGISLSADIKLFKERLRYNYSNSDIERQNFLQEKAAGHGLDIHHVHDIYAPLVNRRFEFEEIKEILQAEGFSHVDRPIDHTEIWLRAVKGKDAAVIHKYGLPKSLPPYWFERE
ncbi:MAG: class I SAM-dependent methyltransferase [Deltaproteobacteria bacterium]|nr:class I SAM-dependent methyltransferase [Deltaproteobacteria bacterium]